MSKLGYLLVMMGLPRSGKTTYIKEKLTHSNARWVRVCPDLVREAIHGKRFIAQAEPFVWATVYAMVDALLLAGHNVVVDGCHLSKKRREPWLSRGAKFLHIETSKAECLRRAREEHDTEIMSIIEKMYGEFEPLEEEHYAKNIGDVR